VPEDGQAQTLYALRPAITQETILPYARFFFAWARGPHGRFHLVEGPEDLAWVSDMLTAVRREVAAILRPLTLLGRGPGDTFLLTGCFVLARSLFLARVAVGPDGVVNLSEETVMLQNLPVRDEALGEWG
jgi:hypothetical protein